MIATFNTNTGIHLVITNKKDAAIPKRLLRFSMYMKELLDDTFQVF